MKKIFKFGTKVIKKATVNIINGIDEGFNGDDIKEVRQERSEIRRIEMEEEKRREKIVTYAWRSAWIAVLLMCAKTIYESGFSNQVVANIWNEYSLALLFPFLIAGIVTMLKDQL